MKKKEEEGGKLGEGGDSEERMMWKADKMSKFRLIEVGNGKAARAAAGGKIKFEMPVVKTNYRDLNDYLSKFDAGAKENDRYDLGEFSRRAAGTAKTPDAKPTKNAEFESVTIDGKDYTVKKYAADKKANTETPRSAAAAQQSSLDKNSAIKDSDFVQLPSSQALSAILIAKDSHPPTTASRYTSQLSTLKKKYSTRDFQTGIYQYDYSDLMHDPLYSKIDPLSFNPTPPTLPTSPLTKSSKNFKNLILQKYTRILHFLSLPTPKSRTLPHLLASEPKPLPTLVTKRFHQ